MSPHFSISHVAVCGIFALSLFGPIFMFIEPSRLPEWILDLPITNISQPYTTEEERESGDRYLGLTLILPSNELKPVKFDSRFYKGLSGTHYRALVYYWSFLRPSRVVEVGLCHRGPLANALNFNEEIQGAIVSIGYRKSRRSFHFDCEKR